MGYINVPDLTTYKCSECGSTLNEVVIGERTPNQSTMIRRCLGCGHEKATITVTTSTEHGGTYIYKNVPKVEEF